MKNIDNFINEEDKHYLAEFRVFGDTEFLFGLDKRYQIITASDRVVKCMAFKESALKRIINPSMQKFVNRATNYLSANQYFEVFFYTNSGT